MDKLEFRLLKADEIDCRVAQVKKNGVSLLLYKDARVDQNILDETVGPMNWQRSHSRENANCTVSIWDDVKKMWVSKEDTGKESNTEAEKGLASDSFKRACFNWGIGRELYTAPFIWISSDMCRIQPRGQGYTCYDRFTVRDIGYDENRSINRLVIESKGKVVYEMVRKVGNPSKKEPDPVLATTAQKRTIDSICRKHKISTAALCTANSLTWDTLTADDAGKLLVSLKRKYGDD